MAIEDYSKEDLKRPRKINSVDDALAYIKKALAYADIEEFDTFPVHELPKILEKYDEEVEPLGPADVRFITQMLIDGLEAEGRKEAAAWN
jgi:hypothetical protein